MIQIGSYHPMEDFKLCQAGVIYLDTYIANFSRNKHHTHLVKEMAARDKDTYKIQEFEFG